MNLLFVIDSLGSGGAQNQITLIATELKKRGHEVTVFTYYPNDFFQHRLTKHKINHSYIPKSGKLGINVISKLRKLLDQNNYDAAISFLDTPNFYLALASKYSNKQTKIIISYRSKTDFKNMSWLERKRKEWINTFVTSILANSHHERKTWTSVYQGLSSKFLTVYNIFDLDRIPIKTTFSDTKKILVVGNLRPMKNAEVLVKAMAKLKDNDIQVHWYGTIDFKNVAYNKYVAKIKNQLVKYGLTEQWIFKAPTKDIFNVYHHYDLLVHPSKVEGLPNVICEAMIAGLPVIASNILDHPILLNNETLYLFSPDDDNELANKIKRFFLSSENQKKRFASSLNQRARELFSKEGLLSQYENICYNDSKNN